MNMQEFFTSLVQAELVPLSTKNHIEKICLVCAHGLRNGYVPDFILDWMKRELRDWNMQHHIWRTRESSAAGQEEKP